MAATTSKGRSSPVDAETPKSKPTRQLHANVTLPGEAELSKFEPEVRDLLQKTVSEMVEYIAHPMFRRPNAETLLFGDDPEPETTAAATLAASPPVIVDLERPGTPQGVLTFTTDQEQLAFQRYNYARSRVFRILWKHRGKRLSMAACRKMIRWQIRALEGRAVIIQANMPLVLAMAKRTRLGGVDFSELISEGNMALLRSADKFDCGRGFKFSTYACRAILKSFSRVAMRASRYRSHFPTEFVPELERSDYLDKRREGIELDYVDDLRKVIVDNTANLSDIESEVIRARFNLDAKAGEKAAPMTLEQVGRIIGVTKERVRQIQNKALTKLKNVLLDEGEAA